MDILFMGDGRWAKNCLQKIIELSFINLKGVILRNEPSSDDLINYAKEIDTKIYQPANINDKSFCESLNVLDLDLIISVSYDQILSEDFLSIPSKGVINYHAGLLPYYRGRSPINWAIINGEDEIGLTVHYIDEKIDTGSIIVQKRVPIKNNDDYKSLLLKAESEAPNLIEQAITLINNNKDYPIKQDQQEGLYLPRRSEGDELLDWSWDTKRIHDFIRALVPPGPCARTYFNDKEIKILESEIINTVDFIGIPGQVIGKNENGIKVKTGNKLILIKKIIDNKGERVPDYKIGTKLGINYKKEYFKIKSKLNNIENRLDKLEVGDKNG